MTTVHTERPTFSPYERIKRIRRCASAIEQGASIKDMIRAKRFTKEEVALAQEMLRGKAARKRKG